MSKRLVWNFEISNDNLLDKFPLVERDEFRWEARFFWPDDTIITLNGLDERFLLLSNYQVKHRQDCYLLLPKCNYNIKRRRSELLYKPLIEKRPFAGIARKLILMSTLLTQYYRAAIIFSLLTYSTNYMLRARKLR
ncbi:hypothetical protein [Legionella tunisiensis]|uniref:hypothetical protein n=1 Tax=Legionella tunisiensis TaxID=1034944 RepID=UPI00030DD8FD|nr:hypothetical protein [Legionella tunisiensis]